MSTVPAAPPIKYFLGYRSRIRSLTLNPNPITDPNPNPKINKKQNDTGMKLNKELYLKVDFLGTGWVYKRKRLCAGAPVPSSIQACLFLARPMHNGCAATYRI